jgi:hypothetical protein
VSKRVCGAPMPKASNGADRGTCTKPFGHGRRQGASRHGNNTCPTCGVVKTKENSFQNYISRHGAVCRNCRYVSRRERYGFKPRNSQRPGEIHRFPCGCEAVLPQKKGQSNFFAMFNSGWAGTSGTWSCRVSNLLANQRNSAEERGYRGADADIPHSVIRKMMREKNCVLCGEPLVWKLKIGQTPHLHHDHETGEQIGFSHSKCNPLALQKEVDRLKKENARLKLAA